MKEAMSESRAGLDTDDVDPDIRRFQRRIVTDYARFAPGAAPGMPGRREVAERVRQPWAAGGPAMARTINLRVGTLEVPVRLHLPALDHPLPALIYLHGGGWGLFSLDTHDRLMREYAQRSRLAVVGIDYSLAPEHPYPRALEEIAGVVAWIGEHGAGHGLDGNRLAIGGDSAGANLAVATALLLRDADIPTLGAMVLNYGAYDTEWRPSWQRYDGENYLLTVQEMKAFWADYLGTGPAWSSKLARPLRAGLEGLPPAFLCIPQCDILADENRAMADRLAAAGVATTAKIYPGATHGFLEAVSISSLASRALDEASHWLARTMAGL
jgi:acetyl esterase